MEKINTITPESPHKTSKVKIAFLIVYKIFKTLFYIGFLISITVGSLWWLSQKPSLNRDWEPQDAKLPEISWSGGLVTINNIRNHHWKDEKTFEPNYFEKIYNPEDLVSLDYIITPFSNFRGPAHTMLSFGFKNGERLVISAEIRKEYGENFDALKGILNQFEIQYVIATETDVIKLRTNHRKNNVILYPIRTTPDKIRHIFRSMLVRADKLTKEPEFYNTLWNNCTTSILAHANAFREDKIGWSKYLILPAESDEILFREGLIDTSLSIEDARKHFMITDRAQKLTDADNFSESIRKFQ